MAKTAQPIRGHALESLLQLKKEELKPVLWASFYFFTVLASYYILRPVRDERALASGVENLAWLFTGTLLTMLLANPLFATLVTRYPRRRFISYTYRFFILNLLIFYLAFDLVSEAGGIWVGRAFYIWTSVFNLFIVSIFWAFMADTFSNRRAKRLFGLIALGGTLGAVAGSSLTAFLVEQIGQGNLLLISVLLLEIAVRSMYRLSDLANPLVERRDSGASGALSLGPQIEAPLGGGILTGITRVWKSHYLLGISLFMVLYTITATFLYFQQAEIVGEAFIDRSSRTAMFARIDLLVNILTALTQMFLTGRIIRLFGVGVALAFLPAVCLFGFLGLGLAPILIVIVIFQVVRRAGNFAVTRPAREILYTAVSREDRYKAKSFIDTFIYRMGDQIGAWGYSAMLWAGMTVSGISFLALPLCGVWLGISWWLGRRQEERAGLPPDWDEHALQESPLSRE